MTVWGGTVHEEASDTPKQIKKENISLFSRLTGQKIAQKITGHINSTAQSPHEKIAAAQLVKKLPCFMEHDGSLPRSKSSPPVPRMWPIIHPVHPKFAGSNPAEAIGFFRAKNSPARLPSEGK
jgi:hypothetical protein